MVKRYKIDPYSEKDSRYRYLDRIYEDGYEFIETQGRVLYENSMDDRIYIVEAGEEGRLDVISYKFYNTPLYWWAIAYASDIIDPLSVVAGDRLIIPPLSSVVKMKGEIR